MRDKERYNDYHREYQLKRYHKLRKEIYDKLGNKCSSCGSVENLEVDHINRETKSFPVSKLWSIAQESLDIELQKCQLLCATCHHEKTLKDLNQVSAKITHGTLSSYRYCRCDLCRKAKADHSRNYRQKIKEEKLKNIG
jgi:5-methylcytosine-specific restriction endonuclease McrA